MNISFDDPDMIYRYINFPNCKNKICKKFDESKVDMAKYFKLYFLYKGHSSWYGTWTQKYVKGDSIFTSLEDAKDHAEELRKQGNVFYILELPVVGIIVEDYILISFQINTKRPFCEIDYSLFSSYLEKNKNYNKYISGKILKNIFDQNSMYNLFNHIPSDDSLIVLYSSYKYIDDFEEIRLNSKITFNKYISKSYGKKYYLDWEKNSYNIFTSCMKRFINIVNKYTGV